MGRGSEVPPQDLEAERAVLAGMLLGEPRAIFEVAAILRPSDFLLVAHQEVCAAVYALASRREPIDIITVGDELQKADALKRIGDRSGIADLMSHSVSTATIAHHARIVLDHSKRRALAQAGLAMRDRAAMLLAPEEIIETARKDLFRIAKESGGQYTSVHETLMQQADSQEKRWTEFHMITGIPSGINELDEMTSGFQPGELALLAARPSVGKTALAIQVALHVAKANHAVAFASIEMSTEAIVERMTARLSGIDSLSLRRGGLGSENLDRAVSANGELAALPIFIDDSSTQTPARLMARTMERPGIALLIVDYLQLVHASKTRGRIENRNQELGAVSEGLKAIAKELSIPVLALAQLRRPRQGEENRRPHLSDLRESGQLEADADLVILLHRPEPKRGENERRDFLEAIVAKQRNGPVGTIGLRYARATGTITPWEKAYA